MRQHVGHVGLQICLVTPMCVVAKLKGLRLTCNRITATKIERNKKHTTLIKNTWKKALQKHHDLPVNWINIREVLVGSGQ